MARRYTRPPQQWPKQTTGLDWEFAKRRRERPIVISQLSAAHRDILDWFADGTPGWLSSRADRALCRDLVAWGFMRVVRRGNSRGRQTLFAMREGV